MRTKIMVILAVLILGALNFGIYQKEQTIKNGETVFLELAPADPRSLMQGDYMRLRYAVGVDAPRDKLDKDQKHGAGYIVISLNENKVAQFVRFHKGDELAKGEKLLKFLWRYSRPHIVPDSFFFQEGHAKYYSRDIVKYGVFKFDDAGKYLLIGLADENYTLIKPPKDISEG